MRVRAEAERGAVAEVLRSGEVRHLETDKTAYILNSTLSAGQSGCSVCGQVPVGPGRASASRIFWTIKEFNTGSGEGFEYSNTNNDTRARRNQESKSASRSEPIEYVENCF